jgi:1-phosphofructokinase/6-phosphofructokinase 2
MIVTVTPNPSIDRTIAIDDLRHGEVHRATSSRVDPGGKGINVSRALSAQGSATVAVLPVGGPEGRLLADLLESAQVPHRGVPIHGSARMNIAAVEPDGTTTKLNEAGPTLTEDEVGSLLEATFAAAQGATWIIGCGSLPPGVPADWYAVLVREGHARGLRVAIDSSGEPMRHAVAAGPSLIKPNREELAELVGRPLATLGEVVDAARDLVAGGITWVFVSLGRDGALVIGADTLAHATADIPRKLSTVGAGDCMLAGVLDVLARGDDAVAALAQGVEWGAAAVTLPGSRVPAPADLLGITAVLDHTPDLTRPLTD